MKVTPISGIYGIFNLRNGRAYIGKSVDIEMRWYCHRRELEYGKHVNSALQEDWTGYGAAVFEWRIIRHVDGFAALFAAESEEMLKYPNRYNIAPPSYARDFRYAPIPISEVIATIKDGIKQLEWTPSTVGNEVYCTSFFIEQIDYDMPVTITRDGIYFSIRVLSDILGFGSAAQQSRQLRYDNIYKSYVRYLPVRTGAGTQRGWMIERYAIGGWLTMIHPKRMRDGIAERLMLDGFRAELGKALGDSLFPRSIDEVADTEVNVYPCACCGDLLLIKQIDGEWQVESITREEVDQLKTALLRAA